MSKFLVLVLVSVFGLVLSQDECILPDLPKFYNTRMQVNIINGIRSGKADGQAGFSIALAESVDDTMGRATLELDYELNAGAESMIFKEKVIWDAVIEGIKEYLAVFSINGVTFCTVDKVHESSILDVIFGLDPEHHKFPSITQMLHFGPGQNYTCDGKNEINGIPTLVYKNNLIYPSIGAHFEVTYHWSDKVMWTGTAGYNRSVPVMAKISGTMTKPGTEGEEEVIDVVILFDDFNEKQPSPFHFNPPSDIWCEGREATRKLDPLPSAFYYDLESIFHHHFPDTPEQELNVIRRQSEWYDYIMMATRTDYKPYDFNHIVDPFESKSGFVSEIKDFHSGVSYITFKEFGNCSASFIHKDISGDVTVDSDGTIHITSPMHFWNLDESFAFNGIHESRGIMMSAFVNSIQLGKEFKNYTTVLEFTTGTYEEEGESVLQKKVPVRFEVYETDKYNDRHFRVRHNIFGFERHIPSFNHFDITPCFFEEALAHRSIRLGWSKELVVEQDFRDFETRIRRSLHLAADITPIRVQNIEVEIKPDEAAMYVLFSVVDWPSNLNPNEHDDIPSQSTLPLAKAIENLKSTVNNGQFTVKLLKEGTNDTITVAADKDFFETIERTTIHPDQPTITETGYSPGAMAALGIFMLLISGAGGLAALVYFFKW